MRLLTKMSRLVGFSWSWSTVGGCRVGQTGVVRCEKVVCACEGE